MCIWQIKQIQTYNIFLLRFEKKLTFNTNWGLFDPNIFFVIISLKIKKEAVILYQLNYENKIN